MFSVIASPLDKLAADISACRVCDQSGIRVKHARAMSRGTGRELLVVGVEPGQTEIETAEAFSGPAGKRLIEWLTSADVGSSRAAIMERSHMTSLCKCNIEKKRLLPKAASNCFPFLKAQIELVNPRVLVTLGAEPLRFFANPDALLETCVGHIWQEIDFGVLFPILPESCRIVPLPHPSPRSTWLNEKDHRDLLTEALGALATTLRGPN